MVSLERAREFLHSQGSLVNRSEEKYLPTSAPYLVTETDVVQDPQEMIHHRQMRGETTIRLFF